jgi:hypothetical protein
VVTYETHYNYNYDDDYYDGYWSVWFWVPNDFDSRLHHQHRPGRDPGRKFDTSLRQAPPPMPEVAPLGDRRTTADPPSPKRAPPPHFQICK